MKPERGVARGSQVQGLQTFLRAPNRTRRPDMTCKELVEFLMDYLDGLLAESERRRFEEHLGECPDCVAYLATYQEAVRLGKEACTAGDSIPTDVPEDLVRAILAARRR